MSDFDDYGFYALGMSKENSRGLSELEKKVLFLETEIRYLNDLVRKMMQEIEELRKS